MASNVTPIFFKYLRSFV